MSDMKRDGMISSRSKMLVMISRGFHPPPQTLLVVNMARRHAEEREARSRGVLEKRKLSDG